MPKEATALLDQRRAALALRSAAGLVFAVAFLWPAIGERTLIDLFVAYAFTAGILTLSPGGWDLRRVAVWPLLIGGCADIAAAVAAYTWPGLALPGLIGLMAIWAIAQAGAFTLAAVTLRAADPEHLLLLSGIAAGLFGRALLSYSAGDLVVVATWTGLYALSLGVVQFKLALRLFRMIAVDI